MKEKTEKVRPCSECGQFKWCAIYGRELMAAVQEQRLHKTGMVNFNCWEPSGCLDIDDAESPA